MYKSNQCVINGMQMQYVRSLKVISRELKVYYNSICLFINDDVIMHLILSLFLVFSV